MNPVAAILDSIVLYRYSLILALASAAGICFFLSCCAHVQIPFQKASAAVLTAVILSLPLAFFSCTNTGLSGIMKLITRNSAAGSVSAQNIQRQPHSLFHA